MHPRRSEAYDQQCKKLNDARIYSMAVKRVSKSNRLYDEHGVEKIKSQINRIVVDLTQQSYVEYYSPDTCFNEVQI